MSNAKLNKKYEKVVNLDVPIISKDLVIPDFNKKKTEERFRLMVFPKTKIPYVDLPHGMKNILFRSHKTENRHTEAVNIKWHNYTTTLKNNEAYDAWTT